MKAKDMRLHVCLDEETARKAGLFEDKVALPSDRTKEVFERADLLIDLVSESSSVKAFCQGFSLGYHMREIDEASGFSIKEEEFKRTLARNSLDLVIGDLKQELQETFGEDDE